MWLHHLKELKWKVLPKVKWQCINKRFLSHLIFPTSICELLRFHEKQCFLSQYSNHHHNKCDLISLWKLGSSMYLNWDNKNHSWNYSWCSGKNQTKRSGYGYQISFINQPVIHFSFIHFHSQLNTRTLYSNFISRSRYIFWSFFLPHYYSQCESILIWASTWSTYSRPTQPLMWCGQLWQNVVSMQSIYRMKNE